jgi:hypothetical protein
MLMLFGYVFSFTLTAKVYERCTFMGDPDRTLAFIAFSQNSTINYRFWVFYYPLIQASEKIRLKFYLTPTDFGVNAQGLLIGFFVSNLFDFF